MNKHTKELGEGIAFLDSVGILVDRYEEIESQWQRDGRSSPIRIWSANEGELKLSRFADSQSLQIHLQLRRSNRTLPMPEIVASGTKYLVERWVQGSTLNLSEIDSDFLFAFGKQVGEFASQSCELQEDTRWRSPRLLQSKLEVHLFEIQKAGVLDAQVCQELLARARSNVPTMVEAGMVHLDLKRENFVKSDRGICWIDNESLTLGPLDLEIARVWGLWNLTAQERRFFLDGYRKHRCTKSFVLHELFWSIFSLVGSLYYRLRNAQPIQVQVEILKTIAEGELPSAWKESKLTKLRLLGEEKIRVAFLMDYLAIGGQERVCYEMIRALDRRWFSPYLYAFRGGAMAVEFERIGIPVMIGSSRDPLACKEWTPQDALEKEDYDRRLTRALIENHIDAALVFSWKTAPKVLRNAGVKVAIDKLDGPSLLGKINDKSNFQWIVAESETLRREMLTRQGEYSFDEKQLETIYSCIDTKAFDPDAWDKSSERRRLGLRDDDFVVGFVGRLIQGKDVGFLVRAFARALKRLETISDRCVLLVCGPDGGALANILEEVQQVGLQDHFRYLTPPDCVARVMSVLDVFAMTSKSEGLPTVILEAMSMGLPILSTATGSIPEVISGNGFVSDPGDWKPFVTNLVQLARSEEKRKRMGEASRRIAARFSSRHAVGRYEELLIDALLAQRVSEKSP